MFKRYDLDVFVNSECIYSSSFSSINLLVKYACGFDRTRCDFLAVDTVFEKNVPLDELCTEMESNYHGI